MKIAATHLCRCGHTASNHTNGIFNTCDDQDFAELEKIVKNSYARHECASNCAKFELPNLDLIEYLAKERGLI